jgi:dTDP-4-amino-4,6-dideoxygalactose transaminase
MGDVMSGKHVRSSRPYFPKEDLDSLLLDIRRALETGRLRNGMNLLEFERMFAEYIGVKNAVTFDSDGDALETALRHYGVEGREVVVCTNSFISIPNSIVYAGGRVVFADIRAETLSMNPDSFRKCVTEKTAGVVVTHIAGFPNPDLKELMEICREKSLFLIEDATHAAGAEFKGQKVGTFGEAAAFAFTPTKVLTTGEGGMLATSNSKLAEEARRFRYYGSGPGKTEFLNLGRHMMLPEISAILGLYQLRRIEEFISKRNTIARIYDEELGKMDSARIIECPPENRGSYYKYPIVLNSRIDKTAFTGLLEKEYGIETGNVFYPPCHLQPSFQKLGYGFSREDLSLSETTLSRTITLPIHAAMDEEDAKYVSGGFQSLMRRFW